MGFLLTCPFRTKLTIDHTKVSSDRTNFALYVPKTVLPDDMFTVGSYCCIKSDGGDIRFSTDADGNTQIAQDVVVAVPDATHANAIGSIRVKVPTISSTVDTTIYCFWGNQTYNLLPANDTYGAQKVWDYQAGDSDYVAVYHMQEASGNVVDSTLNGNTCTNYSTTASAAGFLEGNARDFDKSIPAYMQISGMLGSDVGYSIFAIINCDSVDTNGGEIVSLGDIIAMRLTTNGYLQCVYHYNTGFPFFTSSWRVYTGNVDLRGGYHEVAFICFPGGANESIWVDGVKKVSGTNTDGIDWSGQGSNTFIGKHGNGSTAQDFDGRIQEVRFLRNLLISDVSLEVMHANMSNPATFIGNNGVTPTGAGGNWFLLANRNSLHNTMQLTNGMR